MPRPIFYLLILGAFGIGILSDRADQGGRDVIAGRATIIDGDTIEIRHQRVRLYGVDAPERDQTCVDGAGRPWPCGRDAIRKLALFIGVQPVSCEGSHTDKYDRVIATCRSPSADLSRAMVASGYALTYHKGAHLYILDELGAWFSGRGLWRGDFDRPEVWRRLHK